MLISEDYQDTEDLDGLFSGWEKGKGQYETESWTYRGLDGDGKKGTQQVAESHAEKAKHFRKGNPKKHERDDTLQDPKCVFQILKRHYQRYTPEMVEEVCGTPIATCSRKSRKPSATIRIATVPPPSVTPSAGLTIRSAPKSSAPAPCCNFY